MSAAVTLSFVGDSTKLTKSVAEVNKSLDSVSDKAESSGRSFGDFNESVEKSTGKFRGTADLVDGVTSSLQTFGINIPGDAVIGFARGMADLADGFSTVAGPAIEKIAAKFGIMTAATEAQTVATEEAAGATTELDAAMDANPLGLIAVAIGAVAIGFYELYEHCETFRDILQDVGQVGREIFGGIVDAVSWAADAIGDAFRAAFNFVSDVWNNTVGTLNFSIPSWVPFIGGDSFGVPNMPHFATGGTMGPNSWAVAGERGPELVRSGSSGASILDAGATSRLGGGPVQVQLSVVGSSNDAIVQALRQYIRVNGKNVQAVLGG